MALLPQSPLLAFPFTVEQVIQLGRIPHATGSAVDRSIVDAVMAATDTDYLRQRNYTALSGGEKQRVQMARVLAQIWRKEDAPSRLLLLDEPNNGLDPGHQQLAQQQIQRLAADGVAVAMVMHDFNLLAATANRVLVLEHGRQVAFGKPDDILTPEMFREVFAVDVEILRHPRSGTPLVVRL